jgi:hypothetical protein
VQRFGASIKALALPVFLGSGAEIFITASRSDDNPNARKMRKINWLTVY